MQDTNKPPVGELYDQYNRLVYRFCAKNKWAVKDLNMDAEDLSQECWEKIVRNYHSYDASKSKLTTWIMVVCNTTVAMLMQSNNRDKRVVSKHTVNFKDLDDKR